MVTTDADDQADGLPVDAGDGRGASGDPGRHPGGGAVGAPVDRADDPDHRPGKADTPRRKYGHSYIEAARCIVEHGWGYERVTAPAGKGWFCPTCGTWRGSR